jgi:type I restriction enzyme M protein
MFLPMLDFFSVGATDLEDDGEPFEEKMERLRAKLNYQVHLGTELQNKIRTNLSRLGYEYGRLVITKSDS